MGVCYPKYKTPRFLTNLKCRSFRGRQSTGKTPTFYILTLPFCIFLIYLFHRERSYMVCLMLVIRTCETLAEIFELNGTTLCKDPCLKIEPFNRWGNNVRQLVNAAQVALYFRINRICVQPNFLMIKKPMKYGPITITADDRSGPNVLTARVVTYIHAYMLTHKVRRDQVPNIMHKHNRNLSKQRRSLIPIRVQNY